MSAPANTPLIGWPFYSDPSVLYAPSLDSGAWDALYPLANLQERRLDRVARSATAALKDTRFRVDLMTDRLVRVVALPKTNLTSAARVRVLGVPSTLLFDYEAGDDITAKGGSFARADAATCATYHDSAGTVRTVAANVPRDAHFVSGLRTILLEPSRKNVALYSQDFSTWGTVGTTSRVAAALTLGDLVLDLLGDTDAAAIAQFYLNTAALTGDGVKAYAIYLKKGTLPDAGGQEVGVYDFTAAASRCVMYVTWDADGVPTVTPNTGTYLGKTALADGVYRFLFATTGVTAANTHRVYVMPARSGAAATGNVYAGGVQLEDAPFPGTYVKTLAAAVTRAADALSFAFTAPPQESTWYLKLVDRGATLSGGSEGLAGIGARVAAAFFWSVNAARYRIAHREGATVSSQAAAGPSIGDTVELRALLNADGSVQLGQSLNGAAEALAAASGANALAGAWHDTVLALGSGGTTSDAAGAYAALRIAAGIQTLATMQGAVYDSSWLTPWPTGLTAEQVAGMNLPAIAVLPQAGFSGRYWSVQVDDSANPAGYVEVARACVCGGWQPSTGMAYGAQLGLETATTSSETDGGVRRFQDKPRRRTLVLTSKDLPAAEALAHALPLQMQAGLAGQVFVLEDPTDTTHLHRRAFLAVAQRLSPLEQAFIGRYVTPFAFVEEL